MCRPPSALFRVKLVVGIYLAFEAFVERSSGGCSAGGSVLGAGPRFVCTDGPYELGM